jgi:hypothetical protein
MMSSWDLPALIARSTITSAICSFDPREESLAYAGTPNFYDNSWTLLWRASFSPPDPVASVETDSAACYTCIYTLICSYFWVSSIVDYSAMLYSWPLDPDDYNFSKVLMSSKLAISLSFFFLALSCWASLIWPFSSSSTYFCNFSFWALISANFYLSASSLAFF